MPDVVTEIRIEGMRCIERLRLDLRGLTVLIGDNGSGKSTIIEACEILRRAADENFVEGMHTAHGGLPELLRSGARGLTLGVRIEGEGTPLDYAFTLARSGAGTVVASEVCIEASEPGSFTAAPSRLQRIADELGMEVPRDPETSPPGGAGWLLDRSSTAPPRPPSVAPTSFWPAPPGAEHFEQQHRWVEQHPERLLLTSYGQAPPHPAVDRVRGALKNIEVHVPFETIAHWATPPGRHYSTVRSEQRVAPAPRLDLHATNLVNVYLELRNRGEEHWRTTMDYVRLGLGQHIDSVQMLPSAAGGSSALSLKLRNGGRVLASQLSDGTLAYLAFVALFRLESPTSLLALDEPDLHLHPHLLMRVLDLIESAAEMHSVLLTTHSDRLLDGLSDPVRSAVLCELDENGATRLRQPDSVALDAWLKDYRGLGDIRAAGHEASVMVVPSGEVPGS